jgi:hypothetical protein
LRLRIIQIEAEDRRLPAPDRRNMRPAGRSADPLRGRNRADGTLRGFAGPGRLDPGPIRQPENGCVTGHRRDPSAGHIADRRVGPVAVIPRQNEARDALPTGRGGNARLGPQVVPTHSCIGTARGCDETGTIGQRRLLDRGPTRANRVPRSGQCVSERSSPVPLRRSNAPRRRVEARSYARLSTPAAFLSSRRRLVSRFRSSQTLAATSGAKVGIEGTLATL